MRHSRKKAGRASPAEIAKAVDHFARFLQGKRLRLTGQRAAVVEAALEREGHFPIEDLVARLRRRGIPGSKATVYRMLPLLLEAGILQPAEFSGQTRRFEASFGRHHHDHLVCHGCGKVVEFELDAFEILQREVAARNGFRIESHYHQIVGRCAECCAPSHP